MPTKNSPFTSILFSFLHHSSAGNVILFLDPEKTARTKRARTLQRQRERRNKFRVTFYAIIYWFVCSLQSLPSGLMHIIRMPGGGDESRSRRRPEEMDSPNYYKSIGTAASLSESLPTLLCNDDVIPFPSLRPGCIHKWPACRVNECVRAKARLLRAFT